MKKPPFISNIMRLITVCLVLTSFSSQVTHVLAVRTDCELIEIDQDHPIHTTQFKSSFVKNKIQAVEENTGLPEKKAKGIVGEELARLIMEEDVKLGDRELTSIFTFFNKMGCNVIPYLRTNAVQGIDDIFVVLKEDEKTINRNYNPVFHEAKYNGRCSLKLNTTRKICDQLSIQWLNFNIGQATQRIVTGLDICFGEQNSIRIVPCTSCQNEFFQAATWLQEKLQAGKFHRTASVLCSNGTLRIYGVNTKQ